MGRRLIDLAGQRFGRLVAVEFCREEPHKFQWMCRCDCGVSHFAGSNELRRGTTTSCGCFRREDSREKFITHGNSVGGTVTPEYRSWHHAKDRTGNPECSDFPEYGGRVIQMCPAWRDDFAAFLRDMGP